MVEPEADLALKASGYLDHLCLEISNRRVGSPGNRQATAYYEEIVASFGFKTETQEFNCIDWQHDGALLEVGGEHFLATPSPYSLGCDFQAPLKVITTAQELEVADLSGKIALLGGEIAKEQLMPKNFPFYNPEHHQRIIGLLERKKPLAIIAATDRDPALAGGISPFPLIEDGDFDIPSVYMTAESGEKLRHFAGELIRVESRARRIPSTGCNVIASKAGSGERRIVLTAHIDAKLDAPGALDNATGVVTLLLLAELLQDYQGETGIELTAINGEDYYSASGEVKYLERVQGQLDQILLNINMDGVGFHLGGTAFSLYECPDEIASLVREVFSSHKELQEGEIWYSGDHMIFVQNGVPAVALTSEHGMTGLAEVSHTPRDRPELVDPARLVRVAHAIRELLLAFDRDLPAKQKGKNN
ncbi:MAG TPA: M28 family peptidase [Anaerolineales bacterium]|nr:M28 family peptidase [Anaerolineales bacterium]